MKHASELLTLRKRDSGNIRVIAIRKNKFDSLLVSPSFAANRTLEYRNTVARKKGIGLNRA